MNKVTSLSEYKNKKLFERHKVLVKFYNPVEDDKEPFLPHIYDDDYFNSWGESVPVEERTL